MELVLRCFTEKDIESIAKYANNKKIADALRDDFPHPYTIKDAKKYVRACINSQNSLKIYRAISLDGEAIGSIAIVVQPQDDIYRKSAEIGYWLGEPFWGNGIMTESIKHMCQVGFEYYDLERIYAEIFRTNIRSANTLERAGFTYEGTLRNSICKHGKMYSSCMYSILKDEFVKPLTDD